MHNTFLICPLDRMPLVANAQGLSCAQGHHFDRAREGYFNLLPVQYKKSKQPGDNKSMVSARYRFLNTGCFESIAQTAFQIMQPYLHQNDLSKPLLVDAGCGDGYYLNHWCQHASDVHGVGIDISKAAIQQSTKRTCDATWVVASNASLPIADARTSVVVCAFGFPVIAEFSRVLSDQGVLLVIEPGTQHLIELRQTLYPQVRQKPRAVDTIGKSAEFFLAQTERCQYTTSPLAPLQLIDLAEMTPHGQRADVQRLMALKDYAPMSVTVDVVIRVYGKRKAAPETN